MGLTVIAAILSVVLLFIFAAIYYILVKQNSPDDAIKLTTFIVISQIIILAEFILSHLNII